MGIESTIGNALSGAATTAKIAGQQAVESAKKEAAGMVRSFSDSGEPSSAELDAYASTSPQSAAFSNAKKLGSVALNALASAFPAGRVAKVLYEKRKWVAYAAAGLVFMLLSGFANVADSVKNDPIGFLANNSWCLYVEGKSALECVGCEALENKYGVDSASINCDQIVDATKGAQITR